MKRLNLKLFRFSNFLTQAEMAQKIGCPRTTYQMIECGLRNGRLSFWNKVKTNFNLSDKRLEPLKEIK